MTAGFPVCAPSADGERGENGGAAAAALLAFPVFAVQPQAHAHPARASTERFGTVHFATSCSPAVVPKFDRAVALLHSFEFGSWIRTFNEVLAAFPDTLIVLPRSGAPGRAFGGLRDSIVCPTWSVVRVHDGWLTDVVADLDVRSVAISAGSIAQQSREGREVPLTIPNSYRVTETAALRRLAGRELTAERKVRGLVLSGAQLVALLVGRDEVPVPPFRAPSIFTRWAVSQNDSTVESTDSVEVFGYQFLAGTVSTGATILFDADTVARGIPVGRDGRFTVRLAISHPPGQVTVTVLQRDGRRLTQAQSVITVAGRDAPR